MTVLERLVRQVVSRAEEEYRPRDLAYGYVFFTLVPITIGPLLIWSMGTWVDQRLDASVASPNVADALAIACFTFGVPWLIWGALMDWTKGSGTPLPWFPPKYLLVTGPYRLIRNPQTFGALFWWSGWAFIFNSPAGVVVGAGVIPGIVFAYIRLIEERELSRRFGDRYIDYRHRTPFFLPRLKPKAVTILAGALRRSE